ncbi:hypothetical protein SAMN05421738_11651 [Algoriella xinjiangensis]|uniref:Uncharacterized protein n=1 Tax=Algoriella xinjiangensis TaxID=684065 RepID=A0A1I5AD25_9FLAO|nr:hypothetical protein [Algoriella xinjiangensis]SFN60421.1 hypothetical protein SAMN05421738_11651 [Algoriella xinjiangensis]VDH15597.1 Uncharacterised protein [Algoriella xinjiangensis]
MTIKNLFAIILKLTGFFFIIKIFTIVIPEQITLLLNYDIIFPSDITSQEIIPLPIISISVILIVLLFVYYISIYKTEILMKFLRIENYFGDTRIENINIPIEKYVQISILVISIILLIFNIPELIISINTYFGINKNFEINLIPNLISSISISLFAIILILFSDKISRLIIK